MKVFINLVQVWGELKLKLSIWDHNGLDLAFAIHKPLNTVIRRFLRRVEVSSLGADFLYPMPPLILLSDRGRHLLSSRPACSTEWVPGTAKATQKKKTLSQPHHHHFPPQKEGKSSPVSPEIIEFCMQAKKEKVALVSEAVLHGDKEFAHTR